MEQQGITRKGLLRRRTHVMLRQWQGAILDEGCQVKRSGCDSGSRWSSCSSWMSRAIAKTMEERLRQNDRTLNWWFHDHPWTKSLVGANSAATVLRAPMRHQLSRSFQSAIQMFTEDRGSSIREKTRLALYHHRQKRLPWGVQRSLLKPLVEVVHASAQTWQTDTSDQARSAAWFRRILPWELNGNGCKRARVSDARGRNGLV
jgi:hypothetical protein